MSDKKNVLNEEDIDELVTGQAADEEAWDKPVCVRRTKKAALLKFEDEQLARLPITSDPEVLSGATVFRGTRVPVAALLDNLTAGLSLNEFLDNFPTVTREQAIKVLEFSKDTLARLGCVA